MGLRGYCYESVGRSIGKFVQCMAHTNDTESSRSMLKRGRHGTFHHLFEEDPDRYVKESQCCRNIREDDTISSDEHGDRRYVAETTLVQGIDRVNGECVALLVQALECTTPGGLASQLGLAVGTVNRWIEQQRVPKLYKRDLLRLLGRKTFADGDERDKDQFYTQPETALDCWQRFCKVAKELGVNLNDYTFVEPSAGAGVFYKQLPPERRIGLDIEPACQGVETADYLAWKPKTGKYIVIGNPPFGLRGHLALQFINHSEAFADMVAFILPPLFNSDGKGVPAKRVKGYRLAHTSPLAADSFEYPDGTPVDVESIFQVWTQVKTQNIRLPEPKTCKQFIKVLSLSDGGTPGSTRNKKMLYACDVYLPSTCFTGMHAYQDFEDLPHRRGYGVVIHRDKKDIRELLKNTDWESVAFKSTNGALNLRTSLIEGVLTSNGFHD